MFGPPIWRAHWQPAMSHQPTLRLKTSPTFKVYTIMVQWILGYPNPIGQMPQRFHLDKWKLRISENRVNYTEHQTWRHDLCLKIASIATLLTLGRYNYVNETLSGTFQGSFHNLSKIGSVCFAPNLQRNQVIFVVRIIEVWITEDSLYHAWCSKCHLCLRRH